MRWTLIWHIEIWGVTGKDCKCAVAVKACTADFVAAAGKVFDKDGPYSSTTLTN